jgi:hypothetical protein
MSNSSEEPDAHMQPLEAPDPEEVARRLHYLTQLPLREFAQQVRFA